MAEKPHMNLVFIGHVDHGKSTTVGRLLLDTGHIEPHVIEKYKKEAEQKGKATFEFAWVMDRLKEERERGLTIDVAHKKFTTDKYYFTIIDAPGHRDFVKNMITGTSQADAAVVVISAVEGPQAQTKEHIQLAKTLGVEQIIILINKMDAVNYDEKKYDAARKGVEKLLSAMRYKLEAVPFIAASAFKGDNVVNKSSNLAWYKGPTLVAALNALSEPPKAMEKALRWPVQDVYTITGIGTVPVGRIETGVMKPETKIIFMPANKVGEVKSIEMHHETLPQAVPGDNVGVNVRGIAKNDIRRGDVAGPVDNPPIVAKSFIAQILVINHPSVITIGYTPVFHCHTAQVACRFDALMKKIDPATNEVKEENPQFLKTGDIGVVKIVPTRPMVIETHQDFPQLGRFAIRDMGTTVAAGIVQEVEKKEM